MVVQGLLTLVCLVVDLLVVLVGCVYATVTPIITPFLLVFFGIRLITYRWVR